MVMGASAHEYGIRAYHMAVAAERLTLLHLALRLYHMDHGMLPDALDELVPDYLEGVPHDPFTEKAILYDKDARPPRLVSVGPDQVANGGLDDGVVELFFAAPQAPSAD